MGLGGFLGDEFILVFFFLLYNFGDLWVFFIIIFSLFGFVEASVYGVIWLRLNGNEADRDHPTGGDEPCGHSEENDMSRFHGGGDRNQKNLKKYGKKNLKLKLADRLKPNSQEKGTLG